MINVSKSLEKEPSVDVVDPDLDPDSFDCPGSGFVLRMQIRIRTEEHGNHPNF